MTILLIGLGLLLLAWIVYKKFVALPSKCEMVCEDGVCFPSCATQNLSINNHGLTEEQLDNMPHISNMETENTEEKINEDKKTD